MKTLVILRANFVKIDLDNVCNSTDVDVSYVSLINSIRCIMNVFLLSLLKTCSHKQT